LVSFLTCLKGPIYGLFRGRFLKKRDSGGLSVKSCSFRPFDADFYCMNQPWLTTADWPLCTVFFAAA